MTLELGIFTTDQGLVADLNSAQIAGVRAEYRPKMTFDSAEHLLTIVITAATTEGIRLVAKWIADRYRKTALPQRINIDSKIVNNGDDAIIIINNFIDRHQDSGK